jgi:hypothetical protein
VPTHGLERVVTSERGSAIEVDVQLWERGADVEKTKNIDSVRGCLVKVIMYKSGGCMSNA